MDKKVVIGEFIKFGLVGGLCTALHYGIYYVLQMHMNVNVAYSLGYILSFIVNFYLTSYFTFKKSPSWKKLFGMGGAHAVNYIIHILLLNLFLYMGIPQEWAAIPVFAIAIPINFLLVRFVFKNNKESV